jgi:hypothetical protein
MSYPEGPRGGRPEPSWGPTFWWWFLVVVAALFAFSGIVQAVPWLWRAIS